MTFTEKLRAAKEAAKKATLGEWEVGVDGFFVGGFSTGKSKEDGRDYAVVTKARSDDLLNSLGDAKTDAQHIATMNPSFTLELIERYERMRAIIPELFDALNYDMTNHELIELDQKVRKLLKELGE